MTIQATHVDMPKTTICWFSRIYRKSDKLQTVIEIFAQRHILLLKLHNMYTNYYSIFQKHVYMKYFDLLTKFEQTFILSLDWGC